MLEIRIGYGDMVSELMRIPMSASDSEAVKKILDEGKTGNQTVTVRSLVSPVQPLSEMITGLDYGDETRRKELDFLDSRLRHMMKQEDFINGGTATQPMMDFLTECLRYGISICVAGATSSGKTTLLGWLLTTIPDNKRIYTIESGSRELALVREKEGAVTNSVIHTLTRDSENERQRVDQIALLDMALRFNPDIIVVGEMRGPEANAAQEAARTGVAVVTTIHSNSCEATYRRMVSLCKRAVDMSDETLLSYVTEAYPIVAFCKQLENRERRLMEIQECEIRPDGARSYRPLFQYKITENRVEDGKFIIEGYHEQVHAISDGLAKRLLENGMPGETLKKLRGGVNV